MKRDLVIASCLWCLFGICQEAFPQCCHAPGDWGDCDPGATSAGVCSSRNPSWSWDPDYHWRCEATGDPGTTYGFGCSWLHLHSRYLLDTTASSIVYDYGDQVVPYDRPVVDSRKEIDAGMIKFDYDTYSHKPDGATSGGAALAGGFWANPGIYVKQGFELHWVQTIIASTTGANDWNLPLTNAGEFPDAPPHQKYYPYETAKVPGLLPPPTLGFQDFPNRGFANPANETWTAELGLVCIAENPEPDGFREVRVVATLLWGFDININHGPPFGVGDVTAFPKVGWGPPTPGYLNTLNAFYDGSGGGGGPGGGPVASGKFRFVANDNCFQTSIPEPKPTVSGWGMATLTLSLLAAISVKFRRRCAVTKGT